MLVAMQCLTARGCMQPDKMLVPVDDGGTGKTVFFDTFSRTIWGNGHGTCPSSMLQVAEEWRKQACSFIGCLWMAFDEAKPNAGCEEEILKAYLCGLSLAARRLHETETHYPSWPYTGRTWSMNSKDIPYILSAWDECWARRIRCIRSRVRLTTDPDCVDVANHVC